MVASVNTLSKASKPLKYGGSAAGHVLGLERSDVGKPGITDV